MKKSRKHYDLDYKRQIVSEYVSGTSTADQIAQREGLLRGQIYRWRVQLDQHQREERIESIAPKVLRTRPGQEPVRRLAHT